MFGFLMPHHYLHPYFRYLVDHLELLKADHDGKSQNEKTNLDQIGGALSLLGSLYGAGEDEDGAAVVGRESMQVGSDENSALAVMSRSHQVEQVTKSGNVAGKDEAISKAAHPSRVKVPDLSKNRNDSIKSGSYSAMKIEADKLASDGPITDKSKASSLFPVSKVETLIVDPPSEVKRLVDRIVEIILKNGKDFEAVLIEQDKKHGKFSFLLPSNQYHPYYLNVLKKAQESRLSGKSFSIEMNKNTAPRRENDLSSVGSGTHDSELDCDRKEKFKMVMAKTKKDTQDHPSKETQHHTGITVNAAAAAAILQAATRGIKKPKLDIFSKTSFSDASHGSSNEGGQASSFGSLQSSQHQNSSQKQIEDMQSGVTIPIAKEIANTAARAAAGEADSSEAGMTREQKLKAERLRRAKMFAAMIKSGVAPLGTEPQRAPSVEPSRSGVPGSASDVANGECKDRVGTSDPAEVETSARIEMPVRNSSDDENERTAKKRRHYRSRKHDDSGGEDEGKTEKDDVDGDRMHSRKKHRSHQSSRHHRDGSKDIDRHRRKHSSSRTKELRQKHKHESTSYPDEDDSHDRYKHDSSSDYGHRRNKRKHKHDGSSEDERKHHKRKHKHSRAEEDRHKSRSRKGDRRSQREEIELEEGEIRTKSSDQSSSAIGDDTSTEVSVDASKSSYPEKAPSLPPPETSEVPDELRAKIRAMLLATM